jgi:Tannase and feruloyl esterase
MGRGSFPAFIDQPFSPFGNEATPQRPPASEDSGIWRIADQAVRYIVTKNSKFDSLTFPTNEYRAQIQSAAALIDSTSENLDEFRNHGGKLLIMHGSVDMAIPPGNTIAYYEKLRARYGRRLRQFVRFYIAPGFGHGDGPFRASWDSLSTLDRWVSTGTSPEQQTIEDDSPQNSRRTRPLCEYPAWPRYRGLGSPSLAASFSCVTH